MLAIKEKKHLSTASLLTTVRHNFKAIQEANNPHRDRSYGLVDCLMSGIAIFGLKFSSLLQFDQQRNEDVIKHNLNPLYQVKQAPCDTYLRERLDVVDPQDLRKAFTALFARFQRANKLKCYSYAEIGYLLSIDGTG